MGSAGTAGRECGLGGGSGTGIAAGRAGIIVIYRGGGWN